MVRPVAGLPRPTVEGRLALGRPVRDLAEQGRMASDLHLDPAVGKVEGVERMEDVAGVDLAPPHVVGGAVEGENADASGLVVDPHVGQLVALHRPLKVESAREVEQQHRRLGDVDVMHHRAVADRDVDLPGDRSAVGVDDEVADEVPRPVVGGDVEFAGDGINLGMSENDPSRVPLKSMLSTVSRSSVSDITGPPASTTARVAAGVADHVGVGGALGVVETRAWRDRPACRFGDSVRRRRSGCDTKSASRRAGARRAPCRCP